MITAQFSDDINGDKMIEKLHTLWTTYKKERYRQNMKMKMDTKTGISDYEREKLLNYPHFTEGNADFFGKPFSFSHGPSFVHSVDEIFGEEIYRFTSETDSPYIIDCGANIGLSIYYFKKLFPKSKILAFEPDNSIFEILQKNVALLNDVTVEKKAVWTEDTTLTFFSEGALAGSLVTDYAQKNTTSSVNAVDLKKYLVDTVDFLKIDIEGAENELIFALEGHLQNVKNLFLEYHGLIDQPQNLGEILNLLKHQGFQYYIRLAGETIKFPFCKEKPRSFNQQLNILCYRA